MLLGGVFAALVIGLLFFTSDNLIPTVEQVRNPEASTLATTSNQGFLLTILVLVVPGVVFGTGVALYGIVWFLNREVANAHEQPETPFDILNLSTEGNTLGAAVMDNALPLMIGAGVSFIVLVIAVFFLL